MVENKDDDLRSIYSAATNLGSSTVDGYVVAIAEELARTIMEHEPPTDAMEIVYDRLPQLLTALSLNIGCEQSSRTYWEVSVFIHRHRRVITSAVRDIISEARPQQNRIDASSGMSLLEKMSQWMLLSQEAEFSVPTIPHLVYPSHHSEPDSEGHPELPAIRTYTDMIRSATSYSKLLVDLRRDITMQLSNPDIMAEVHSQVIAMLPQSRRISRQGPPETFCMSFNVDWDPLAFIQKQEYKAAPKTVIRDAIVVTGGAITAQAMTCVEYMRQTWPSIGEQVLDLIQNSLEAPYSSVASSRTPRIRASLVGETITAPHYLEVAVSGHASWIGELAEILAWMGSALRSSTISDGIQLCIPLSMNGKCWHGLFKAPVVAKGFPISRRPTSSPGLEIPLDMMATLTDTTRLNSFNGKWFIKGFSTLLLPTNYEKDGERISYSQGTKLSTVETHISSFQTARHILGWCSESKLCAGSHDADYNVQPSHLRGVSESSPLFGTSISMGQIITRGRSLCLGKKDLPVNVTRNGYARKLKWVSKKFVLLWDEEDQRGWLINGTSALLHLVRAALHRDKLGELSSLISFDPSKLEYACHGRLESATRVLSNRANLTQRIYDSNNEPPTNFQDYVTGFYDLLEKMIDHQMSQLEGWDFDDLASERDPIYPRVAQLNPAGRSWAHLVKAIHAITLLGCHFGEIIRPAKRNCTMWSMVPTGRSYLAVSRGDLMEIMTAGRGDPFIAPVRLIDSIIWYIPEGSSTTCRCNSSTNHEHSNLVQILLPASMANKVSATGRSLGYTDIEGAVIFGYNSEQPWYWPDYGEPSQSIPILDHGQEIPMGSPSHDSGIGQSVSSSVVPDDDSALGVCKEEQRSDVHSGDCFLKPVGASHGQKLLGAADTYRTTVDYAVAIICTLHKELKAVRMLFDETHDSPKVPHSDPNHYVFGSVFNHNVVATCLPHGEYGTTTAADVASNMKRSFSQLRFCLLVGIGGGVPGKHDIRLGDVVVSTPSGASTGILPYDTIKTLEDGLFQINGYLHSSPRCLRSALSEIQSDPGLGKEPLAIHLQQIAKSDDQYTHPGVDNDTLFKSEYTHVDSSGAERCKDCDSAEIQIRSSRDSAQPHIHYGLIASGNQVMKNASTRDRLGGKYGIMCFEMEAAGIMNILPCLVIRGICDYCDSHKNKQWQKYAAATAAAFAKLLLSRVRPDAHSVASLYQTAGPNSLASAFPNPAACSVCSYALSSASVWNDLSLHVNRSTCTNPGALASRHAAYIQECLSGSTFRQ
ncbi:hypothetical protein BJX64DRAFT_280222 [Aspergillus heterothallicus]